jgi:hypothetical protein
MTASDGRIAEMERNYPARSAVVSWIFFDWATQPFFTLITTFVFAPYFATHVAPDPASGQALWGFATGAAGLVIALSDTLDPHGAERQHHAIFWIVRADRKGHLVQRTAAHRFSHGDHCESEGGYGGTGTILRIWPPAARAGPR